MHPTQLGNLPFFCWEQLKLLMCFGVGDYNNTSMSVVKKLLLQNTVHCVTETSQCLFSSQCPAFPSFPSISGHCSVL